MGVYINLVAVLGNDRLGYDMHYGRVFRSAHPKYLYCVHRCTFWRRSLYATVVGGETGSTCSFAVEQSCQTRIPYTSPGKLHSSAFIYTNTSSRLEVGLFEYIYIYNSVDGIRSWLVLGCTVLPWAPCAHMTGAALLSLPYLIAILSIKPQLASRSTAEHYSVLTGAWCIG